MPDRNPSDGDTVTIPRKTYDDLLWRSAWLGHLEAAGVDNWEGISHAHEMAQEELEL